MASLFTRSFVALLLAQASFGFAFSSYFLLPKFLATELGAGPAQIGLVGALWGGTYMLLGPLLGVVVDRLPVAPARLFDLIRKAKGVP